MGIKNKVRTRLVRLLKPDKAKTLALSQDMRQLGVNIITAAAVGLGVNGSAVVQAPMWLLCFTLVAGSAIWLFGLYLSVESK